MTDYSKLTDDELNALILKGGGSTTGDMIEDQSFFSDVGGYLKENLEVPASIGGALAGAAAGSAVPVVGTIAGGIIGGAAGAFGGSLASDVVTGEELDLGDAAKEAALSATFDVATLGAGKVLRPVAKSLDIPVGNLFRRGLGIAPKTPSVRQRIVNFDDIEANTPESLRITQEFLLSKGGGGLSAAQTGQAGAVRKIAEGIGDTGLFSGIFAKNRIDANNQVIKDAIDELIDTGMDIGASRTIGGVGEVVAGAIETGRSAAKSLYKDGLNNIIKEYGKKKTSTKPVAAALEAFEKRYRTDLGSKIGRKTLKEADKIYGNLFKKSGAYKRAKTANIDSLIQLQKDVTNMIQKAMPNGKNADPKAVKDLTKLNKALQSGVETALKNISPNAASAYKQMNKVYSETMTDLFPKINSRIIAASEKGDYDTIGKLLVTGTNKSKIGNMMSSIDAAFAAAKKAKVKLPDGVPQNAKQAKKFVRQGYVQELFRGIDDATDFTRFGKMAKDLNSPEVAARAKIILGEDYGNFRRIVNAIADTSRKQKGTLFDLAIRQRELGAAAAVPTGIQAALGVGAASVGGLGMGAMVFLTPMVLSKIATNRFAVNRLLALNEQVARTAGEMAPEFFMSSALKIIDSLDDEDKDAMRRDLM